MRKTSVYLTDGEFAALRRAARHTGRSQSDLIRDGVRRVTNGIRQPPSTEVEQPEVQRRPEWFTRQEEIALSLTNAKHTVRQIAQELRVPTEEALDILKNVEKKMRFFSSPRPTA